MKKVLIFTAGFGEGHNTAARNIRDGIESVADSDVQVEILDLFESCYGPINDFARKAYQTAIHSTPRIWKHLYQYFDNADLSQSNMAAFTKMKRSLEEILASNQPDAVVSTYPLYNYLIDAIYQDGRARTFSQITMVTDSISVNSIWYRCHSDFFLVPNEATAEVMQAAGVPEERLRVFGFPVPLIFAEPQVDSKLGEIRTGGRPKILYVINSGKSKAPKVVERLLSHPEWDLTISTGRDAKLREEIEEITWNHLDRVQILGWTNQMPQLMLSHHLMISKAGGATVQETIAARCPLLVSQVVPGQEEGNWELLQRIHSGALAEKPKEIEAWAERAFADNGTLWSLWRENLGRLSRPGASLEIARFVLEQCVPSNVPVYHLHTVSREEPGAPAVVSGEKKRMLLCDFHTHTTYSDGKLTVRELIDFYGQRGFDCLCITDHLCDPARLIGKICNLTGLVLPPDQVEEYFETIEREKVRALQRYGMILMTGVEFNKDGYTKKTSAHLLGIDLKQPIDPCLDLKTTIAEIHKQGGLAVASHPHEMSSAWGKNTLYLWENQEEFAPLLDAWEIANRDDLFNPVGLKRLPFIANSDFHKPKHIRSWKTLLFCEKEPEAIKACIRLNQNVALTLYREHRFAFQLQANALGGEMPLIQSVDPEISTSRMMAAG